MNSSRNNDTKRGGDSFHVAHIGNSIQYYNDCPRLLERMLRASEKAMKGDITGSKVHQNSCLKGGATLPSLWVDGNGMEKKFASRPESKLPDQDYYDIGAPTVRDLLLQNSKKDSLNERYWDFIAINDHTQCVRHKFESMTALETHYLPTIVDGMRAKASYAKDDTISTTMIFIQTAAYKSPVKRSSDLGTFDEFTSSLVATYTDFCNLVKSFSQSLQVTTQKQRIVINATMAPLGEAYQRIRNENFDMWSNLLYANDDFHPSPHGTMLEACLLYCVISGGKKFDLFDDETSFPMAYWWETARYMQPTTGTDGNPQEPLPLPTREEAIYLNEVAYNIFQSKRSNHE